MRVAKLWHYVLIGRVLAFLSFAFLPGAAGFLDQTSHWLVMAAGLPCDVVLTVIGQAMRRPRPIAHQRVRTMAMLCMALIALGTLLNAAAMFAARSEEHTSELQSLMRISYAVFCLKKKTKHKKRNADNKYRQQKLSQHRLEKK